MSIRKRGRSWQVDVAMSGKRFRKNYPSEALAQKWEAIATDCLTRGKPVEESGAAASAVKTMGQLRDLTYERYWKGSRNERNAIANARAVVSVLGETTHPATVTPSEIDGVVQSLKEAGNSTATINRKLSALSKMLRFAADRGIIDRVPKIEKDKETEGRIRWYSREEEDRFLAHLEETDQRDFRDLVIFLMDTGARAAEAGRARWRDLDDLYVRLWKAKSKRPRAIPLTQRLKDTLRQRREYRLHPVSDHELIFPGWLDSEERATKMSRAWSEMIDALGVGDDDAVLHACRHTFATRLVQNGVSLYNVKELLGHTSIKTTERYAHLSPSNLVDAVATLDRVTA